MSNFPLYDDLKKSAKTKNLSVKNRKEFIKNVSELDKNGHELLYALIKSHYISTTGVRDSTMLPYDAKLVEGNMEFDFNLFPNILKHILYTFTSKHKQKMLEDEQYDSNRMSII